MILIVDKVKMIQNVERAKRMSSSPISLMFKDFYIDMYNDQFKHYKCFSNDSSTALDVSSNIGNMLQTKGKVITSIQQLEHFPGLKEIYVPINFLDNREGLSFDLAEKILKSFNKPTHSYLMITSGCINEYGPTLNELESLYNEFKNLVVGISVGGSYYLQFGQLPKFISEVRIGEYMLYGTIPYCQNRTLFGTPSLIFQTEVLEVYPERKQIIINGGTSTINAKSSTLLSGGLEYSNASCDYTIYNDPFGQYKVGDTIEMIPDYNSLKLLRYVAREYKE